MTENECACRQAERDNLVSELATALEEVIGWVPGRSAWHTDAAEKSVERARAVLAKVQK